MIKFGNTFLKYNGTYLTGYKKYEPYNPLNLPDNTIRVKFKSGYTPSYTIGDTRTLVDSTNNVWDIYKQSNDWTNLFQINNYDYFDKLLEVLGANTTNVTNMTQLFKNCTSLTSIALFDTSNVTNMSGMFGGCTSLTTVPLFDTYNVRDMSGMFGNCESLISIPLFNTSNVTTMFYMFYNCLSLTTVPLFNTSNVRDMSSMFELCTSLSLIPLFDTSKVTNMSKTFQVCYNVQSGALALYQQASTQTAPPTYHTQTFFRCGVDTYTGRAELEQIPDDWK